MPVTAATQAGSARYRANLQEAVRLGLLVGYPLRLTPGENRISRALKEIEHMEKLDLAIVESGADMPTYAERFNEIHGLALGYFKEVLSAPIPFDKTAEALEYSKLHNVKLQAAAKTMGISARLAIERFRAENVGALRRLLERMKEAPAAVEAVAEPTLIGFDDEEKGAV